MFYQDWAALLSKQKEILPEYELSSSQSSIFTFPKYETKFKMKLEFILYFVGIKWKAHSWLKKKTLRLRVF